jgi:hypothetical protein
MAEIEPVVQPGGVADNILRESVPLVGIHPGIVSQGELTWQYRQKHCRGLFKLSMVA